MSCFSACFGGPKEKYVASSKDDLPGNGPGPKAASLDIQKQGNNLSNANLKTQITEQSKTQNGQKQQIEVSSIDVDKKDHSGAPITADDDDRVNHLCGLNILDSEPERRFDDITKLCCMVFKTPIALVSLVDKERQWFKSVMGLDARETERPSSFCAWTLVPPHPEVLVVPDAFLDVRFSSNPLVTGPPHIRFYAGCPLISSNAVRLGSLCIIDREPREFDAESCTMLCNMAEMVVREIEKEKMMEAQKAKSTILSKENTQLIRAIDCFAEGVMLCDVSEPQWPVMFLNDAWEKHTGVARDVVNTQGFWDLFHVGEDSDEYEVLEVCQQAIANQQPFEVLVSRNMIMAPLSTIESSYDPDATPTFSGMENAMYDQTIRVAFRCATMDNIDRYMPLIGIPAILANAAQDGSGPQYYFACVEGDMCRSFTKTNNSGGSSVNNSGTRNAFSLVPNKVDPFDDVKLGQLLGSGSFGRVYRGLWNGALVAVKVLEYVAGNGSNNLEALLTATLTHPNVVQTYKHCTRTLKQSGDIGQPALMETWMIMEFCNKGTLGDAIERGAIGRLDGQWGNTAKVGVLLSTAREVVRALIYLHSLGILHGDLTGNNIMMCSSERDVRGFTAKVADFGLSRMLDGQEVLSTRTYGTVTHMAPEVLMEGQLSRAADVYSFGVIMWEMICGKRPYSGMSPGQIIHSVTSGRMLGAPPGCPTQVRNLLQACCAHKGAERPNCGDVLKMIEELMQELM